MRQAKEAKLLVVAMATTVREAILAEQAGCDAVVAQGSEAGDIGARLIFRSTRWGPKSERLLWCRRSWTGSRFPSLPPGASWMDADSWPRLFLAPAVQMGTRFLTAAESGAHEVYQQALLRSTEESTVITKAFSGRPARGIRNAFIKQWDASGVEPLPFPTQNTVTRDIRNAANRQSNPEYMSLWAGQGTRGLTSGQPAADIVAETIREALLLCPNRNSDDAGRDINRLSLNISLCSRPPKEEPLGGLPALVKTVSISAFAAPRHLRKGGRIG